MSVLLFVRLSGIFFYELYKQVGGGGGGDGELGDQDSANPARILTSEVFSKGTPKLFSIVL